jgi:photosystem II stability/assembly factor-like uncharacterized protein
MEQPEEENQPSEQIGLEEDEGKAQSVVFTERLKSGYSTARNEILKNRQQPGTSHGERWQSLGPDNLGGRVTCLINTDELGNDLIAGAACGGIWYGAVTDQGSKLQCKWTAERGKPEEQDDLVSFLMHNIGALAIDRKRNIIYCGTGNAYDAADSFPGVGLFCSKDNGRTWGPFEKANKTLPQRISTIAVDGGRVWVGGVVLPDEQDDDSSEPECSGIFSMDSENPAKCDCVTFKLNDTSARRLGLSPRQEIFKDPDYRCHSIVLAKAPTTNGEEEVILAAISASLDRGGIWRSRDKGETWEQLTRGLPPGREFGRTNLAVAKTNENVVYAFVGATDGRCLGVFRSSDGGDHWVSHGAKHFAACGNLYYANCLAVSPHNADLVVCGATDLHRSTDGGQTWTRVTDWFAAPGSFGYSHADHHALLWPAEKRLYSANDGGVDVSTDGGITWKSLTRGLEITMFYDIDVAASFGGPGQKLIIAGGTQDNASVMTDFQGSGIGYVPTHSELQLGINQNMGKHLLEQMQPNSPGYAGMLNFDASGITNVPTEPKVELLEGSAQARPEAHGQNKDPFVNILYGDGGWTVFDPYDPLHVYGTSQNMAIYRHRRDNGWQVVTPEDATEEERSKIWMAIIAMHPHDSNIVFTGSTRVWRTNDDGDHWRPVSDDLDGSPITAIEIADKPSNFIYVGTEKGNIFKSEDGGNRWNDEPGEPDPKPMEWRRDLQERSTFGVARTITRIEAHPEDGKNIVVTLMGFDRKHPLPHVLWFDGEHEWKDLSDAGAISAPLPNVHHNVVTWDKEGEHIFVGNDVGVWALHTPGGKAEKKNGTYDWFDISANLPNAIVTDLVYHRKSESLTAATYGRSLWRLNK